jgi:hypothetical protein
VVLAIGCAITLFMTLAISSSQHGKTDRVATTVRDVVAAGDR